MPQNKVDLLCRYYLGLPEVFCGRMYSVCQKDRPTRKYVVELPGSRKAALEVARGEDLMLAPDVKPAQT